jgi:hypothetical protein
VAYEEERDEYHATEVEAFWSVVAIQMGADLLNRKITSRHKKYEDRVNPRHTAYLWKLVYTHGI